MRIRGRVLAAGVAALLALGLCHCGAATQPEEVAANQLEIQQPFEGHETEDLRKLKTYVDRALEKGRDRVSSKGKDSEEADLAKAANKNFKKANKAYRDGEYAKAEELYEGILKGYPTHYGANVNLTLALLQQNDDADALTQALTCVYLFPKDGAVLLNVQTAGAAMGFKPSHVEEAMNDVAKVAPSNAAGRRAEPKDDYASFYRYNKLWDRIETELHEIVARRSGGDEADAEAAEDSEADAVEAEEGASDAIETEAQYEAIAQVVADFQTYNDLAKEAEELEQALPDDADVTALRAYLYAVGLQLGFEADPTLVEPVRSMPFVAVDNDLCLIRVTGLTKDKKGEEREVGVEVTNRTAATMIVTLDADWNWSVNGSGSVGHLERGEIPSGETQSLTLQTGYLGNDELTAYAGVIEVSAAELDSVLARYPITWAAPDPE